MLQITIYLFLYIVGIIGCKKVMDITVEDDYLEDKGYIISTKWAKNVVSWLPIVNLMVTVIGVKEIIEDRYSVFKVKRKLKKLRDKYKGTEQYDIINKIIEIL